MPIESNEKKGCPEKAKRVLFNKVGQWCEYEFTNTTAVELKSEGGGFTIGAGCTFPELKFCLGLTAVKAGNVECTAGTLLKAKVGKCYDRVQYLKKTEAVGEEKAGFILFASTVPGELPANFPEAPITLE
jgi:hypothetical protein